MTGLLTGLLSCVIGTLGAWLILQRLEWVKFHLLPLTIAEAMGLTFVFILGAGLLLQSRAFALKASVVLRNE